MTDNYNQILIPVADAEAMLMAKRPLVEGNGSLIGQTRGAYLYAVLCSWILVHFTAVGFLPGMDRLILLLQLARYILWPVIVVALAVHLSRAGGSAFVQVLVPIGPYFVVGVIAGIVGFEPITSARLLIFWLLGVVGAAVVGLRLPPRLLRGNLLWFFSLSVVASIMLVLVKPSLGVSLDNRVVGGGSAWNGIFPGKNLLGLICVYGVLLTIFAEGLPKVVKLGLFAMFGVVLFLARSQGAVAATVAVVAFYLLVSLLRRAPLSVAARSALLVLAVLVGAATVAVGYTVVSDLLGRDATLTGRTEVWPVWLARAMTSWPIGFGPGSFTETSLVTIDLSASEQGLGAIHTPHNMFIAIFGEVGLFGLIAYLVPLLYFAFVLPFVRTSSAAFVAAAIAFTTLVSGMSETREVFGLGMNMFLIIATYASSRREGALRESVVIPPPPTRVSASSGIAALGT